jgi:hypothetical protein
MCRGFKEEGHSMTHTFEEIDYEGLEALKAVTFIEFDGMLFTQNAYDQPEIDALLSAGVDRAIIQYRRNHQSLISYVAEVEQQHKAGDLIRSAWLNRLVEEFPQLYPTVLIESSPDEVIISVRSVFREE